MVGPDSHKSILKTCGELVYPHTFSKWIRTGQPSLSSPQQLASRMSFFNSSDLSTLHSTFVDTKRARDRMRFRSTSDAVSREILTSLAPLRDTLMSELQTQMQFANGSHVTIPIWTFQSRVWNTPAPSTLAGSAREQASQARRDALEQICANEYETVCEEYEHYLGHDVLARWISMTDLLRRSDVLDRLSNGFGANFRVSWERGEVIRYEDEFTLYRSNILLHYYPRGRPAWYTERLTRYPTIRVGESGCELRVRGLNVYSVAPPPPPTTPPLRARTSTAPPPLVRPSLRSSACPDDDIEPRVLFTDKNCVSRT